MTAKIARNRKAKPRSKPQFTAELDIVKEMPKTSLDMAKAIIYGDRELTHGAPSKNLTAIAGMFSMYLSSKFNQPLVLDAHDVCMMMPLVKIARQANNRNPDNVVDVIGYAALDDRVDEPQINAIPVMVKP